jgi:hypothetical protein
MNIKVIFDPRARSYVDPTLDILGAEDVDRLHVITLSAQCA